MAVARQSFCQGAVCKLNLCGVYVIDPEGCESDRFNVQRDASHESTTGPWDGSSGMNITQQRCLCECRWLTATYRSPSDAT